MEAWGLEIDSGDIVSIYLSKCLCNWALAAGIVSWALLNGTDATTAMGYAGLVACKVFVEILFVTGEVDSLALDKVQHWFWLVLNGGLSASILL
jgi:uncharacterized membrane protein